MFNLFRYQVNKKKIASFFPLHNLHTLNELYYEWFHYKILPWEQPLFKVKEYFGEKIGLYFQVFSHGMQIELIILDSSTN